MWLTSSNCKHEHFVIKHVNLLYLKTVKKNSKNYYHFHKLFVTTEYIVLLLFYLIFYSIYLDILGISEKYSQCQYACLSFYLVWFKLKQGSCCDYDPMVDGLNLRS